jgi:hypothetical protein
VKAQPVPVVSSEDVERVTVREFAAESPRAREILQAYGDETWHREVDRVRLAVLKLGAGDIAALRTAMEMALEDYRDVLAVAEYPGYDKLVRPSAALSEDERQRIIDADWQQYSAWLKRPG